MPDINVKIIDAEEVVKLLKVFLEQKKVDKMRSKDGLVKVYNIGEDLVRIDIKRRAVETEKNVTPKGNGNKKKNAIFFGSNF